jgi:hypothetical protein
MGLEVRVAAGGEVLVRDKPPRNVFNAIIRCPRNLPFFTSKKYRYRYQYSIDIIDNFMI